MLIDIKTLAEQCKQLPTLDWQESLKLANNNKNIAQKLLQGLCTSLPQEILTIQELLAAAKLDAALAVIHKLHGLLCYVSAPRLKATALASETLLRSEIYKHNTPLITAIINMLIREAEQILSLDLEQYLE